MTDPNELRTILEDAARGRFPPADGTVRVVPSPPGPSQAVVAFTAHHVIAVDLDPEAVTARIPEGDIGAPLAPSFLSWLGEELHSAPGSVDVVLAARGTGGGSPPAGLRRVEGREDDRVRRARRYRDYVAIHETPDGSGVVTIGHGLAGRWEVAIELNPGSRGEGLGRATLAAARDLVPDDDMVFAQVAAGNASSLRAFLAAGFTPIGSEVLFLRPGR
jgi:GNAT superfamily N-acetyltransferase